MPYGSAPCWQRLAALFAGPTTEQGRWVRGLPPGYLRGPGEGPGGGAVGGGMAGAGAGGEAGGEGWALHYRGFAPAFLHFYPLALLRLALFIAALHLLRAAGPAPQARGLRPSRPHTHARA